MAEVVKTTTEEVSTETSQEEGKETKVTVKTRFDIFCDKHPKVVKVAKFITGAFVVAGSAAAAYTLGCKSKKPVAEIELDPIVPNIDVPVEDIDIVDVVTEDVTDSI